MGMRLTKVDHVQEGQIWMVVFGWEGQPAPEQSVVLSAWLKNFDDGRRTARLVIDLTARPPHAYLDAFAGPDAEIEARAVTVTANSASAEFSAADVAVYGPKASAWGVATVDDDDVDVFVRDPNVIDLTACR